ncbi:hypothetical protein GWP43_04890 [Treponema vincentii]|uniref:Uncharacterized protein n=1 Tax=Treponema vincentii TaxID=69710 RepID=A0A6P1XZF3_9SPIR|nr:hypothetical protein [Treponema vincentii]QHX42898.1 hypothetical protein GWP43_04890 [Treponema vincentii]
MFEKIKSFFNKKRREHGIEAAIAEAIKAPENEAERLAIATCDWVELLWNGTKQKFLIHKTNFQELLTCGSFPNILYKFIDGIAEAAGAKEAVSEVDFKKMKEEEDEFLVELAKKSMVTPTYQECYDAILKIRGISGSAFNDVIPKDFLNDLFLLYLTDWEKDVKKNLVAFNLPASEESQNTTNASPAATLKA